MSADNNNENDIVLTEADLAEAKAMIEGLIKADKNKLLFLSAVSSLISSADSVTGKLSAKAYTFWPETPEPAAYLIQTCK